MTERYKTLYQKVEDIFAHTDAKVAEVMRQLVDAYNRKCARSANVDIY